MATTWTGPSYCGMELFCRENDGWVEVIDSEDKQVVRLSLAAAEDLAHMIEYQAKYGRQRARVTEATAPSREEPR